MSHNRHVQQIKKGENLYTAGQHKAALAVFESVLREDPYNVAALNDAGSAADEIGETVRAVEYYEKALELDHANECAFFNLIDLLAREEATDLAIEVFQKYRSTIPHSREFRKYAEIFQEVVDTARGGTDVEELSMQIRTDETPRKHIVIVAQPRSGSTIFWETLRQDRRFTCFDEPFRPHLRSFVEAGSDDRKQTLGEYLERADLVKRHWSTIQPYEEFYPDFIGHQEAYVRTLLGEGEHVCIDFIRCNAKIDVLRRVAPEALIIHLIRDPRSWVTSHMRPYGQWLPGLPQQFFTYEQSFDFWSRQKAAHAINAQGYAHEQLLHVWNHFVERAEAAEPDLTIRFEHFALDPESVLRAIYHELDLTYPVFDLSGIKEPNPPHAPDQPDWSAALNRYVSAANQQFIFDFNSVPVAA